MSSKNTLRAAVIVSWTSMVIAVVVSFWEEQQLAPPLRDHLESLYSAPFTPFEIIGLVLASVLVVASIGLLFLARWARSTFLWTNISGLCLWPTLGPSVAGPWETLFGEVSLMGFGFVIAFTYFGEVKQYFGGREV